ncbi:MAG TPA: glycosyltransferase [Prolixibacteraceae bacterium]|nr:glycosyltransferase [Prolixibacteraceae bacterium]
MEILAWLLLLFLILRTIISFVNLISNLHLADKVPVALPKVSVLIPARNEEAAIGRLLKGILAQDYPLWEAIICNDHSSDNTEEILNWFAGEDERVHWFLGEKLPEGWLGKNYACYQLAMRAKGEYLLFLDADVELSPDALSKAVNYFEEKDLTLLSLFPQQRMHSLSEWSVVPVMNWILQSLLPMILARITPNPSLSAANGQFMMFDAENYRHYQWHSRVRTQNVEDIHLARMIKSEGLKMAVMLGDEDVFCRMYHHLKEGIAGFSRNIHEYFGGKRCLMLAFWTIVFFGPLIVWFTLGWKFLLFFAAMVIVNRICVAIAARQNILGSVFLHPLQMLGFTAIVFYNIYSRVKKNTTWKGRKINL